MKPEESLEESLKNMRSEFHVSYNNVCRRIAKTFVNELEHFDVLLKKFVEEKEKPINEEQLKMIKKSLGGIFRRFKIILVEGYEPRFTKNLELFTMTMYDFFIKKLKNPAAKAPNKKLERYMSEICKFSYYDFYDELVNRLSNFENAFEKTYINNDDEYRDFDEIMKKVSHGLICELQKTMQTSAEDKQDIAFRYNMENKKIVGSQNINKR